MGHDIGIRQHYLADKIKEQYARFERIIAIMKANIVITQ